MSADILFESMHQDLFDTFGRDAIVAPVGGGVALPVRVVVNEGVERIGEYGQSIGRVTTVDFLARQYRPVQGDVLTLLDVTTGAEVWSKPVASTGADDGFVVKVVMHG